MTVGTIQALADAVLNLNKGTTIATNAFQATHAEAHTADPGPAGTTAAATQFGAAPQRVALTWAGSITGTTIRSLAISATVDWPTATGAGTITHLTIWGAATGTTTFRWSVALTTSRTVAANDILRLNTLAFTFTPVAT